MDVLRYWVGAHACQSSAIQVSDNMMESTKQDVDKIRNTLRFIISNLNDQDSQQSSLMVFIHCYLRMIFSIIHIIK